MPVASITQEPEIDVAPAPPCTSSATIETSAVTETTSIASHSGAYGRVTQKKKTLPLANKPTTEKEKGVKDKSSIVSFLLPGAVQVPGATFQANSHGLDDIMEQKDFVADDDAHTHVVAAELALDEEDVATRVAERLEKQIKEEVQAQLSTNRPSHLVAEAVVNFNVCHVPKKTWIFILLVLALVVGGIVFGVTNRRSPTIQTLLSDGASCSSSNQCNNGCCSSLGSNDGQLKCSLPSSCTDLDDSSPTTSPITLPLGTCGEGSRGNGICPDNTCCSTAGWCGTTSEHCSLPTGSCGEGNRGNGICADNTCCSQYGYCGITSEHCTLPNGTCGDGNRGNGICEAGSCCSNDGWCGSDAEYCTGPEGSCGNGSRGNGICTDGACCSEFGYCGTSIEHCTLPTGTCGDGDRGNSICAEGYCCSPAGWCGTTSEHCTDVTSSPTTLPVSPPTE